MRNKRPLVGIALLFCAGILIGSYIAVPCRSSGIAAGLLALAFLGLYRTRFHSWVFYPLPFVIGIFAIRYSMEVHSPFDLRNELRDSPQHVRLRGVICDWPETRLKESPRGEFGRTSLTLRVEMIRRTTEWEPAIGRVLVHFVEFGESAEVTYGDEVELEGAISPPPIARNPGQFDYRRYLARQGIFYQCQLASSDDIDILRSRQGNWVMQVAADANVYFKKCLAHGIERDPETVGLMWAIVLGFRPGLTNELAEPFMKTGTLHVFAVSGFHIALVGSILVGGLRLCRLSRKWSGLISIPLLLIYTLITGAPASAVRSFIMASVVIFGYSLLRPCDILNSLAAAAIIVLAINPQQLFDAGFQLSFFVVLAIALFTPRVNDRLLRWAKPDPFLPWDVVPKWRRRIFYPLSRIIVSVAVSLAAVLGSIPLIAYYFGLFTPVAVLSNLFVVPLSGVVISLGFFSMLTGQLFPWATDLFNNANYFLLNSTVWLNDLFARIPWGYWRVEPPPWGLGVFYYAVVGAILSGWAIQSKARKIVTGFACGIFLAATTAWYVWPRQPTLTVLDVGGGQSVVLDQPGPNDLLVDGGRRNHGDFVIRPFLRNRGMDRFNSLLLTVNDINHAGGLIPTAGRVPFDHFYESFYRSRSKDYRELTDVLAIAKQRQRAHAGGELQFAPSVRLQFMHPPRDYYYATADDNSIVFQMQCNSTRILFKSNIGERVERSLVDAKLDLRSHILITGQHPRETCCSEEFLDCVQPEVVILNAGSFPTYAYPRQDLLDRLHRRKILVYRTDENGAVVVTLRLNSYSIQPTLGGRKSSQ